MDSVIHFAEGLIIFYSIAEETSETMLMDTDDPCWVFVVASCSTGALLTIAFIIIICLSCTLSSKSMEKDKATSVMDEAMHMYRTTRRKQQQHPNQQTIVPVETFTLAKRVGPSNSPNEARLYVEEPGKLAGTNHLGCK